MTMAVSQVNRQMVKCTTFAAASVGTVEALIWTSLSLISILFYHSEILVDDTLPTSSYRRVIYELFLESDAESLDDIIVTTTTFSIFMYIYVILSFVWLISSLCMFWAVTRNKWKTGFPLIGGWAVITLLISALDITLMSVLTVDFVTVKNFYSNSAEDTAPSIIMAAASSTTAEPISTTPSFVTKEAHILDDSSINALKNIVYTSYGIIITLAARGYILWIVNVVFACILLKFAYDIKKEAAPSLLPIMDAYATSGRPWNNLYEQTDISNGYSNDAFKDDNDGSMFPRSDSFITDSDVKNRNPLSNGTNPYDHNSDKSRISSNPNITNGRVAKIGKRNGRRTPPQNVPPPSVPPSPHNVAPPSGPQFNSPYIPDPDYTPPPSPRSKPKSVLRPKSNYVL